MNLVIFGLGKIYNKNKEFISPKDNIVALLDNNKSIQGNAIDGVVIYEPTKICNIEYDKIVLMSDYANEMKKQLLSLGCRREDILHYSEYFYNQQAGKLEVRYKLAKSDQITSNINRRRVLIITTPLGYHGGAMAIIYAARELSRRDCEVVIAAPKGDKDFLREFEKKGFNFILYPNLEFAKWEELFWIRDFEYVIVNTFPMILCAMEIGRHRPVSLWLHDSFLMYQGMQFWEDIIKRDIQHVDLKIFAVSDIAKNNFICNITNYPIEILPYGIPDERVTDYNFENDQLIFAMIGSIYPLKQQEVFLEAIKQIPDALRKNARFILVGKITYVKYGKMIETLSKNIKQVEILGEKSQKDMKELYQNIDVVVVSSKQDSLPMVATEAMMYGKVCIVSDTTGTAQYIEHQSNGLICQSGSIDHLAEQMKWCINNRHRLKQIGENARVTYEKYFGMRGFGERLEKMLIS